MKVFISWSGQQSQDVASLLRDWLPELLPRLEIWLQNKVLGLDDHWLTSMSGGIRASNAVIACVTADSLDSEWQSIGSLETSDPNSPAVIPWMVGLRIEDAPQALKAFPPYGSAHSEVYRLVNLLNDMSDVAEDRTLIEQRMTLNWARFEIGLEHILNPPAIHMVGGSTLTIGATIKADGEVHDTDGRLVDQYYQLLRDVRGLLTRVLEQPHPSLALKNIPEVKKRQAKALHRFIRGWVALGEGYSAMLRL